jgi:hypothetical protein
MLPGVSVKAVLGLVAQLVHAPLQGRDLIRIGSNFWAHDDHRLSGSEDHLPSLLAAST